MKSYDEIAKRVFERRDAYLAAKRKRVAAVKKFALAASGMCAVVLAVFCVWKSGSLGNNGKMFSGDTIIITENNSDADDDVNHGTSYPDSSIQDSSVHTQETSADSENSDVSKAPLFTQTSVQMSESASEITVTTTAYVTQENSFVTSTLPLTNTITSQSSVTATTTATTAVSTVTSPAVTTINTEDGFEESVKPETSTIPDEHIPVTVTTTVRNTESAENAQPVTTTTTTTASSFIEPPWEERPIYLQFPTYILPENGVTYSMRSGIVPEELIGRYICTVEFEGYDVYTGTTYYTTGEIYTITDIAENCALAVKYEGCSEFYSSRNMKTYFPETLGDLIDDMNLTEHMSFGNIYADNDNYIYSDVDDSVIWDMLLSDRALVNLDADILTKGHYTNVSSKYIGISTSIPLFGITNRSIGVTRSGYLTTNIADWRSTFFIGEEKALAFINYIESNYTAVSRLLL